MSTNQPDIVEILRRTGLDHILAMSCTQCVLLCDNKEALDRHLRKDHYRKKNGRTEVGVEEKVQCPICFGYFSTRHVIKKHLEKIHMANTSFITKWFLDTQPGPTRYLCVVCEKFYQHVGHFKAHQATVHGIGTIPIKCYRCHLCQSSYTRIRYLRQHQRKKHQDYYQKPLDPYEMPRIKSFMIKDILGYD